ncbi:hypothetical protein ZWY2020_019818 [Hordeum vulgare]|nr:hypothetical protein ZWY2020_019818 [Hordeum vulgare]
MVSSGPSESHSANNYFSPRHGVRGGRRSASPRWLTLGVCIERYPRLYGSDDRLHACITELGVPLSREYGFHQLGAFYEGYENRTHELLAASLCYDKKQKLTLAISLGYVVQVYPSVLLPPELERSERTYIAFNRMSQRTEFDFDTKEIQKSMCKKPILFFLKDVWKDGNITRGSYIRSSERDDLKRKVFCFRPPPLSDIDEIQVSASPLSKRWHLAPRRLCSAVKGYVNGTLFMFVRQCVRGAFGSASDSLD